jgi:hypothetical protein
MTWQPPEEEMLDIKGIDKAELLAALYNGAICPGMGRLHDVGAMTVEQARLWVAFMDEPGFRGFDYVCGRQIKSDLRGDRFWPALYDRDAGKGKAAEVVAKLRKAVRP